MVEREGAVTFKGKPLTVIGEPVTVGEPAPDAELTANDLSMVKLSDARGRSVLVSVVPSLDTRICDEQTRRFNEEIAKFGDGVIGYTVSADLPFAQARWCGAAGIERVQTLSDHKEMAFGEAYGTWIKELRIEQRAVFVIDPKGIVRYAEYVPEVAQHPDYEAALKALKEVAAG